MSGAGVMLMSSGVSRGSLCASNEVSALIEELQYTLGEGPCVDAVGECSAVLEPDLANPVTRRWSAFSPPVLDAGARALFAFPMSVGALQVGALDFYRSSPGSLTDDQHADALVMADVAARWVLDTQAEAAPGEVAGPLALNADFHLVVHNAAGMVSVQLGVSIDVALVRLRASAFSTNRLLRDVAQDVVAGRIRFE